MSRSQLPAPGVVLPGRRARRATPGRLAGLGVLIAAVLLPAATAAAYWSISGTGTGNAAGGTVSVSADGATVTGLYPGLASTVTVTVHNPGNQAFTVTALTGGPVTLSGATGVCAATAVSLTAQSGLNAVVSSGGSRTMSMTVTMASDAGDGCQGAAFTLPVTVDGRLA